MGDEKKRNLSFFFKRFLPERESVPEGMPGIPAPGEEGPWEERMEWGEKQRMALSEEPLRRQLMTAAKVCLERNNTSQDEMEFQDFYHLSETREGEYDFRLLADEGIFGREAKAFWPYAGQLVTPPYPSEMVSELADQLNRLGECPAGWVDYTDPAQVAETAPEIMKNGLQALALLKTVQGPLRDTVNSYLMLDEGVESAEVSLRWKQLGVLTGARNAAIHILNYYATEEFVKGADGPAELDERGARRLSDSSSSLHFVNTASYRQFAKKPVRSLTPAQTAYMSTSGDHRAFYEADCQEHRLFLSGQREQVAVSHRLDYLTVVNALQRETRQTENLQTEKIREPISLSALEEKREIGKKEKRSLSHEGSKESPEICAGSSPGHTDPGWDRVHDQQKHYGRHFNR